MVHIWSVTLCIVYRFFIPIAESSQYTVSWFFKLCCTSVILPLVSQTTRLISRNTAFLLTVFSMLNVLSWYLSTIYIPFQPQQKEKGKKSKPLVSFTLISFLYFSTWIDTQIMTSHNCHVASLAVKRHKFLHVKSKIIIPAFTF